MKITILQKIARQVEGEQVFCKVIMAHTDVDVIKKYLMDNDLPRTEKIQGVDCVIEYGVMTDIEVEGD
jgi:hypothetical protein